MTTFAELDPALPKALRWAADNLDTLKISDMVGRAKVENLLVEVADAMVDLPSAVEPTPEPEPETNVICFQTWRGILAARKGEAQ